MIDDPEIPRVGVFALDHSTAQWRVWAPKAQRVELVLGSGAEIRRIPLEPEPRGFHAVATALPEPGQRYAYSLDGGAPLPDPCSRWQPDGIFRPSAVWFPEK